VFIFRSDQVEDMLSNDRVISVLYVIEKDHKPLSTFVLMCYPKTRRAVVFDIPGEIGMLIRRINRVDRIDTVYNPQRISIYEDQIESLLGVDITFSITIAIEDLGKMVDLIDSVELFIPSQVKIYDDDDKLILFPSGITRLDGDKAISFISYNVPNEDNEVAVFRRQRFFQSFLKRQAEMSELLNNPVVFKLLQSYMQTNLNQRALSSLFEELFRIDMERTSIHSVGGNLREVSGKMLLIPHYDGSLVKEIVRQALTTLTSPIDSASSDRVFAVEVLNGTTVTGLAGRTAEILRGFGFDVISIGNADHSGYDKTVIIDRSGIEEMVRNFAGILRCDNILFEAPVRDTDGGTSIQSFEYRSDFTLIIGRDFNGRYVIGN